MSEEKDSQKLDPEEIVRMRGEIISAFSNIESGICKAITAYFLDPELKFDDAKSLIFLFEFLYHDLMNFSIKKDIFKKICRDKKINNFPFEKLMQLQKIRNKFAHAWSINHKDGKQKLALVGEFFEKDTMSLYNEYKKLFKEVNDALHAALKNEPWYGKQ